MAGVHGDEKETATMMGRDEDETRDLSQLESRNGVRLVTPVSMALYKSKTQKAQVQGRNE